MIIHTWKVCDDTVVVYAAPHNLCHYPVPFGATFCIPSFTFTKIIMKIESVAINYF